MHLTRLHTKSKVNNIASLCMFFFPLHFLFFIFIFKAIMRSFSLLQESIVPYIPTLIGQLTHKLLQVSKVTQSLLVLINTERVIWRGNMSSTEKCFVCFQNPSKPHFNHYLFESLCLSVRITCKANPTTVSSFEEALFPVFTEILQNDVQGTSVYLSVDCDETHLVPD